MPTFPSLPEPVRPQDVYVVPARIDLGRAREAATHAINDGILRPPDIAQVELADPVLLYVPFWRVAVTIDGFHVEVSSVPAGGTGVRIPVPTGGSRFREGVVMIPARTAVPYEARLPTIFGAFAGPPPLEVGRDELVPGGSVSAIEALAGGEVVDADVDQTRAEGIASGLLLSALSPAHAMHATYEPRLEESTFCLYPMYYAPYRYEGEARRHAGEELFVAVSGTTGEILAARYPSAVRAMANKLRKLLSFDFR